MAKRILVAGDSFAAEWPTGKGWVHKMGRDCYEREWRAAGAQMDETN